MHSKPQPKTEKSNGSKTSEVTINVFFTRLLSISVLPLLLLAMILAGIHAWTIQNINIKEAESQLHNVGLAIDRDLQARISAMQMLADSPFLDESIQLEEFYKVAHNFRKIFSGHVILADLSTQMLLNTRVPLGSKLPILPVPKGFAAAPFVMQNLLPAVGDVFIGPIANKNLVAVVVPVLRHGKLKALLLSIIDASLYQRVLDEMAISQGYSVTLFDSKEAIIAHLITQHTSNGSLDAWGGRRFNVRSQIARWSAALEVSNTIFYRPLIIDAVLLTLAIIIALISSLFGGKILARQLVQSITSLTDASTSIKPKNLISEIEDARAVLQAAAEKKKLSDVEISKSEALYRSLFEAANVGKSITFPTGEINANKAFADMLGYSRDEIQNKTWQEITPPEEIDAIQKILAPLLNGEQNSARFTKRYIHKNGSYIWADVSVAIHRDQNGQPLHFITTIVDITEHKKTEEERQKFVMLADSSSEFIGMCDLNFNPFYVNPAGIRMVGLPDMAAACQVRVKDYFFPEDQRLITEEFFPRVLREGGGDVEIRLRHFQTGEPIWMFYYLFSLCDASGEAVGWATVSRDITEHKRAEEETERLQAQLQQAQKMESVGRLAGGVAHDFNNMLSIILGYTDMALENIDSTQPLYDDLKEVHKAAERSAALTRQLLAFARKQIAEPKILELNDVVGDMLKMLQRLIGEDIDLVWMPGADLGLVMIDPAQVDQILANLCVNARDAISGVGKVTIETCNATFDAIYCAEHPGFLPGAYVMLAVSDDGIGMDKETVANIFEPFFSTKAPGKGTGLGLSTVYGIAKQNNGFINVYSEPGKGTTFKIYLQKHETESEVFQIKTDTQVPTGGNETVLFVEDEAMIMELGKRMLENLGYQVLAANTPHEAIQLSKEYSDAIDLLITDIVMPEMNGKELAEQLKNDRHGLKILFMSGYTANVIAHHGILNEGLNFLPKPFSNKELALKIRKALTKKDHV